MTADEMMIAKGIVSGIIKDGLREHYLKATPEFQKDIMLAYFDAEIAKFQKFQTKLITNAAAKNAFIEAVLSIL